MRKYITIEEAVENCEKEDYVIPSEFLSIFPNNFGINLCAIKGFDIEITDDYQYKHIGIDFIPVEERSFSKDNNLPICKLWM